MAKKERDQIRWLVDFRCIHCGSVKAFLYMESEAPNEEQAVRLARAEGNLSSELWEHFTTGRLVPKPEKRAAKREVVPALKARIAHLEAKLATRQR
jgi:predicted  nucleic acid-binding Zn-ribbon protein